MIRATVRKVRHGVAASDLSLAGSPCR